MDLQIRLLRLTPTEAEIALDAGPAVELRGRLVGPSCEYSTTVEVAYPIRGNRVVIPEPAWWDTDSPFLYAGPVELWQGSRKASEVRVLIGLCHTRFDNGRAVVNGRATELRVERLDQFDEALLRGLRAAGRNAVVVPAESATRAWEIADRIGLFVMTDEPLAADPLLHPSALTR